MRNFTKYYCGDQIKEDEMGGTCSNHGGDEKCIRFFFFTGKPERKTPLGRPRRRWERNSRLILGK